MLRKLNVMVLALMPMTAFAGEDELAGKSMINLIIENAGFAGWTTIALSVFAFALIFRLIIELKSEKIVPPGTVDDVITALEEDGDAQKAYSMVHGDPSFMGKVLEGGLSKMDYGYDAVVKGADDAWETEMTSLLQTASYVQLIGQVAPMLGLFGTVSGMMQTFKVLAESAGAAEPKALASGIMVALVTTFIGLLVAIPVNMVFLFIRNKITAGGLEVISTFSEVSDNFRDVEEDEE